MSLSVAFTTAQSALQVIENRISVTSSNISNASTAGYTRESYTASYVNAAGGTTAISSAVQGTIDRMLTKSLIASSSDAQAKSVISDYLESYDTSLGGTNSSDTTLSSSLDGLLTALSTLGTDSSSSNKDTLVTAAEQLASQLNNLSSSVQSGRLQASEDISTSVDTINSTLDALAKLNDEIVKAEPGDAATASLEDQRTTALQTLSQQIGVQYYIDSSNALHVYTDSGSMLLGSTAHHLSYTATSNVSSQTVYPGGFSAITLDGQDITPSTTNGALGALIQLRDTTLPNEQAKLDAFSNTLTTTANSILNQGASMPARSTLTSDATVDATDAFSATGSVRIATTDSSGVIQGVADIDLSSCSTVGDVVNAINSAGISGVSASIDSTGHLEISGGGMGVSINEMDSMIGTASQGFSDYFGLNDLFTGTHGASDIAVSSYLVSNSDYLATGSLSSTAAIGESGLSTGDTSISSALSDALSGNLSFTAAGGFAAQSNSLSSYAATIISSVATAANDASNASDTSSGILSGLQTKLSNETGVDINTETANATILQNYYSANAQLLSVLRQMFSTLMNAYTV